MKLSRRNFLRTGTKVGVAAVFAGSMSSLAFGQNNTKLGNGLGTVIPKAAQLDPLYRMTRSMFAGNKGSKFTVKLGGVKLTDMTLAEVNDLNPSFYKTDGTGTRDCYSLIFQGPRGLTLRQDTYTIEHTTLGTFQLFIVPGQLGRPTGTRYEAVINRLYP